MPPTNPSSAILVLFFVLLALILYKYRHKRRVQAFLNKFTPFKVAAYSDLEKKRSSMGAGLLFTDGYHGDALMNEKRTSLGYGAILPAPVTHPDPAAARPERPDGPPQLTTAFSNRRPGSPISPFEVSPVSAEFPRSPPPTVPRRASQDSLGGVSIASSSVFSPSLLSWPSPPSGTQSVMSLPPSTSHGMPPSTSHGNLAQLAAKYQPLTPTKPPMTPTGNPGMSSQPVTPSNWQKPSGWD